MNPPRHQSQTCVLITGMHRSGTSATARALNIAGVSLGGDLMQARSDNPHGFWEPLEAVRFNNKFMRRIGLRWHSALPFPTGLRVAARSVGLRRRISSFLERDFRDVPLFAIKDPRLSRIMHYWIEVLRAQGMRPVVVVCVRHPDEVCQSLLRRNGLSRSHALALWRLYCEEALSRSSGVARSVVVYERFLTDPLADLERIGSDLDLPLDLTAGARKEILDFVKPTARHERSGRDPRSQAHRADPNLTLYRELSDLARRAGRSIDRDRPARAAS